jgi:hypothetical protein
MGNRSEGVVGLEAVSHHRYAGNRGALALGRIPFVLEADLQGQAARPHARLCELANVELESDLRDIASQAGARIGLETMSTDEELRSAVIHKAGEHNIQLQPEQVTVRTRAREKSR